jgi:adenine-specific DNA-methyltransferase
MPLTSLSTANSGQRTAYASNVRELHRRCGIYTKPEIVSRILNDVGWRPSAQIFEHRLLEPAAGDGAFVTEAARRLVAACRRFGLVPSVANIGSCILAYEIFPPAALRCRTDVIATLRRLGIHPRTAASLAQRWVIQADFLLSAPPADGFSHTVGNPPYIRWSKIPAKLRLSYSRALPREMTGGDLFLPFLDRALDQLQPGGKCGFLCSDRWRFMAFAEAFRRKWLARLDIIDEQDLAASAAFVRDVDAYPAILTAKKLRAQRVAERRSIVRSKSTLSDAGYVVKVGPALGHTQAYVLRPDDEDVEPELLAPWLDGAEIEGGLIRWRGRRVITMYGDDGRLRDLRKFPRLAARLRRFSAALKRRSIVANGAPWYRTIDRVRSLDWSRPKLLIPELARVPRLALDVEGRIPSHGVYAIFAPNDDLAALYDRLQDGGLAVALDKIAPKVKGGYTRCYKRFLERIVLA